MIIPKIYRDPALQRAYLIGYAFALGVIHGRYAWLALDSEFKENDHPRDKDGRFAPKGKGVSSRKQRPPSDESLIVETLVRHAMPWREIEPTKDAWKKEFPTGKVNTPYGEVKIGVNQFNKLLASNRAEFVGLLKPTLERPLYIASRIESPEKIAERKSKGEKVERESVLQFINAFKGKDGKAKGFLVATVSQDGGIEVAITAHRRDVGSLARTIRKSGILMKYTER